MTVGERHTGSRREALVARSLDPARVKAERRVQKFLDAARELMATSGDNDVTLQQILDRSGQSLHTFYQHFAGKHELMLLLFEEQVQSAATHLEDAVARQDDPLDKLRTFVTEYYLICRPEGVRRPPNTARAMAEFARELLVAHPAEAALAFAPLVALFERLLNEAAEAGKVRPALPTHEVSAVVLQAVMFSVFAITIGGGEDPSHEQSAGTLWELILDGVGVH